MEVITYETPQKVRVRKYPIDCYKLCELLRNHKKASGLGNREIAESLNTSITKVEHWFRQDNSFAIPDEKMWINIKELLSIKSTEFDESIMTFEEKDGVFEKGNRTYDSMGIAPTITCGDAGLTILERIDTMEVEVIGQMDNTIDHTFESANRVYDKNGLSPTINCCGGGGLQPKIIDDTYANREPRVYEDYCPTLRSEREGLKTIETILTKGKQIEVASTILAGYERTNMTGFNADNGVVEKVLGVTLFESDGFGGWKVNKEELSPTIRAEKVCAGALETIRIKQATSQGYIECEVGGVADLSFPDSKTRRGRVQENGQVSPTLMAGEQDICRICAVDEQNMNLRHEAFGTLTTDGSSPKHNNRVMEYTTAQYRIRKLTPKECWRLMDFTDEDFEKAAEVNSNTQLYKQAGNSIVKNVLVAIIGQMLPGKEEVYKEIQNE